MQGFTILLLFALIGQGLNMVGVPLPGNVVGLILLLLALMLKVVKVAHVEEAAKFLLSNMMLFFLPVLVSTMAYFDVIGQQWWPILLALVGSTVCVMLVTGWVVQAWKRKEG